MCRLIYVFTVLLILNGCQRNLTGSDKPICLHPSNQIYFLYKGEPTILITSAEHYGSIMNADFNFDLYLTSLEKEGMNYTRIFTGPYSEMGSETFGIANNTMNPAPGRWLTPWACNNADNKYNLEEWNSQYFERLHLFMAKAMEQNIVVEVTLFTSYYADNQWNITPFNPKNNQLKDIDSLTYRKLNTPDNGAVLQVQEQYVRKMVKELNKYPNFFFEIQNEPWADNPNRVEVIAETDTTTHPFAWQRLVETANQRSLDWQKIIAGYIVDEENNLANKHLIAQNISNFRNRVEDLDTNVSILNFHYAYPIAASANLGLNRVIGLDETGFMPHNDFHYRSQAWKFLLAGGALYNNLDYSFTVGNETGNYTIDPYTPGWGGPAFRKQLKIMKDFFSGLNFIAMKPDNSLLRLVEGELKDYQLFSEEGKCYVAYLEQGSKARVQLTVADGTYQIEWLNPVTGETILHEDKVSANGKLELVCPEFAEDLVMKGKLSE